MKKISNRKMCHEALAKIIFGHFCRHGIRTWKSWPSFFKFQFMFILAILCNRRQETISIWLNIAFNYSFLRTPVGWIKCECHYWLVCVQTLPPPPTLPTPCNKNQRRGGIVQNWPLQKRNWKQCLCKILGWQTKSVMVFSGVVNICSSRGAGGEARHIVQTSQHIWKLPPLSGSWSGLMKASWGFSAYLTNACAQ